MNGRRWSLLLVLLVSLSLAPATPAPKVPAPRIVVGLKDPLTPAVIAELKNLFGARIVNFVSGNTYALVLLRPGETLADVQALSKLIVWVEPEIAMGAAGEPRLVAVVVAAPTAKEAARERQIKAKTTRARELRRADTARPGAAQKRHKARARANRRARVDRARIVRAARAKARKESRHR